MAFLTPDERAFLGVLSRLAHCNPFLPERIAHEREVLGPDFREGEPVWSMRVEDPGAPHANLSKITERVESLAANLRGRLASGAVPSEEARALYEDAALYLLYRRYNDRLDAAMADDRPARGRFNFYPDFLRDWEHLLSVPDGPPLTGIEAPHAFAGFFQIRRAFHHIFHYIVGSSMAGARLRAAVWQSIFTHDMHRYRDGFYGRMGDLPTLITGPTGTGKELVARAIAFSRYIPFDPKGMTFGEDFAGSFHPLNLSAMPSTLIESELFGHRRGAFTGALQDRKGWLEACGPWGAVFLDEVGDLEPAIQVKLLRVLQTRTFQPLGDTKERRFHGKIIAATNRDLFEAMEEGRFREDFYYRLCSDLIVTPSLREQVRESPAVLRELLVFITRQVAGHDAETLAEEVGAWIEKNLDHDYEWPGNIRELEQCVRSVLIRKEYRPRRKGAAPAREEFLRAVGGGALTADELLRRYCTLVYSQTGSYQETARRLGLDHRTVKSKIDPGLLNQLRLAE